MLFLCVGCKKEEEPPRHPPVELPDDNDNLYIPPAAPLFYTNFDLEKDIYDIDNVELDVSYGGH